MTVTDCNSTGFTQGGSNADVVITDAYLKNISEGIDWNLAYEAVVKDAEEEPPNWDVEGITHLPSKVSS
jgi:putative alpha-1,2-mannosidase